MRYAATNAPAKMSAQPRTVGFFCILPETGSIARLQRMFVFITVLEIDLSIRPLCGFADGKD